MFFTSKIFISLSLLIITATAGILPLAYRKHHTSSTIKRSNACARGVFLAAGFVHFLPDALHNQTNPSTLNMLSIFSLVAFTILLFEYIAKCSWQAAQNCAHRSCFPLYALIGMLCMHSLIEGIGIGIQTTWSNLLIVSFAIVVHKVAVSFSLAIQMMEHHIKRKKSMALLSIFALMTPLGILLSLWFTETPQKLLEPNDVISAVDAVCAGTFMYIGLMHHETTENQALDESRKSDTSSPTVNLLLTLIGFACMTTIAYWA